MKGNLNKQLSKFIERFNDGQEIELIEMVFGSFENFFNVVKKNGNLNDLQPYSPNISEELQSELLLEMLDMDTTGDVLRNITKECCGDVTYDNGEYYYTGLRGNGELSDLKELFSTSRNHSCERIAEVILTNEYYEMFTMDSFDYFVDVVNNLNIANQERLKKYILENHRGFEFDDGTILGDDNVIDAINDQSYFDEIYSMDDNLEQALYDIYSQAYNNAWESEQQKYVYNELKEYFDIDNLWAENGQGGWNLKIKIRNYEQIIRDYLKSGENGGYSINYYGYFLSLLTVLMSNSNDYEYLSFHIVQYPSYVDKHINELFGDYI